MNQWPSIKNGLESTRNSFIYNIDPYGQGWIAEIEIEGNALSETLLSAQEYQNLTA